VSWLEGKTWDDLKAIEVSGQVLFPEVLRRRGAGGGEVEEKVLLRVPTEEDRVLARVDAMAYLAQRHKRRLDTVEDARKFIGDDRFDAVEVHALVARCVHNPEAPKQQHMLLSVLIGSYAASSIFDLYDKLDKLAGLLDPRVESLTDEQFFMAVGVIAKIANISPLAGMRGATQSDFIVRMAQDLWASRQPKSPSPSGETSTQG
jgi:hypothetical protein